MRDPPRNRKAPVQAVNPKVKKQTKTKQRDDRPAGQKRPQGNGGKKSQESQVSTPGGRRKPSERAQCGERLTRERLRRGFQLIFRVGTLRPPQDTSHGARGRESLISKHAKAVILCEATLEREVLQQLLPSGSFNLLEEVINFLSNRGLQLFRWEAQALECDVEGITSRRRSAGGSIAVEWRAMGRHWMCKSNPIDVEARGRWKGRKISSIERPNPSRRLQILYLH